MSTSGQPIALIDARLVVQGIEKRTMKITASNDPHRLSRRHWAAGRTDEHSTEYKGPYQVDTHPDIYDTGDSLLSTVQQMTFSSRTNQIQNKNPIGNASNRQSTCMDISSRGWANCFRRYLRNVTSPQSIHLHRVRRTKQDCGDTLRNVCLNFIARRNDVIQSTILRIVLCITGSKYGVPDGKTPANKSPPTEHSRQKIVGQCRSVFGLNNLQSYSIYRSVLRPSQSPVPVGMPQANRLAGSPAHFRLGQRRVEFWTAHQIFTFGLWMEALCFDHPFVRYRRLRVILSRNQLEGCREAEFQNL
uniref:Uncharacterized protein n=1 Tax=Coccidioides posadasii RMSCC 3488 TaxID=454284 RepID=A0A0J6FKN0_COCPO|nr:hypothetical protein CPAG_07197 [Coccidioides posadasii RMSCC 3488]